MLSQQRKEEIREMAKAVTTILGEKKTYPINLFTLLSKFEIKLFEDDMDKAYPNKNISGVLLMDEKNNKREIYINSAHADTRNKFTVAHELGHFFLHSDLLQKTGKIFSFRGNSEWSNHIHEKEADFFAAELLMPKDKMFEVAQEKGQRSVNFLASYFGVSQAAMSRRIEELNAE